MNDVFFFFRGSLDLGYTHLSEEEIEKLIDELTLKYRGNTYHFLKRNCNHFSQELVYRLVEKSIPNYINR